MEAKKILQAKKNEIGVKMTPTKVKLERMDDIGVDHSSGHTIANSVGFFTSSWEETSMVTLLNDNERDGGLVGRIQDRAGSL